MLSEEYDNITPIEDILNNLEIDPELKCIIYECLHAKDKVSEKE